MLRASALKRRDATREWRFAALAGLTAGLALSPVAGSSPPLEALGAAPLAVATLAALRPRAGRGSSLAWLVIVCLLAGLAGLLAGGARIAAIDAGALRAKPGAEIGRASCRERVLDHV